MRSDRSASALDSLLWLLTASRNSSHRWDFARFSAAANQEFTENFASTLKRLGTTREEVEGEVTAVLALRLFWRLVPRRLFTSADPDYESLAEAALEEEFGGKQESSRIDALALVYRRMRDAQLHGRPKTSLDLSTLSHRCLLADQAGRCRLCRYRFPKHVREVIVAEDFEDAEEQYLPAPGELALSRYFRKPALDHILPVFIGGDDVENWQILCTTCNLGKGEALSWLFRRGWLPPARMSDALTMTPAMRFAGLAVATDLPPPEDCDDGKVLRLFKKDDRRLLLADNLRVEYF